MLNEKKIKEGAGWQELALKSLFVFVGVNGAREMELETQWLQTQYRRNGRRKDRYTAIAIV